MRWIPSTVLFIMIIFVLALSVDAKPLHLVSDVDDTIKQTHIVGTEYIEGMKWINGQINKLQDKINFALGGLGYKNSFAGMKELYQAFVCHSLKGKRELHSRCMRSLGWSNREDMVTYLSAAPGELNFLGRNFLRKSGFPFGRYIGREDPKEGTLPYKTRELKGIFEAFPNHDYILIGDNGEHDPEAFYEGQKELNHMNSERPKVWTFIHRVYEHKETLIREGQIPFLTAADLAIHFYNRDWIAQIDLNLILSTLNGMWDIKHKQDQKGKRVIRESILPSWAQCSRFFKKGYWPEIKESENNKDLIAISNEFKGKLKVYCGED